MSDCPYEVGDRVQRAGLCGTITDKNPLGNGWILTVKLDDTGDSITWDCAMVEACDE